MNVNIYVVHLTAADQKYNSMLTPGVVQDKDELLPISVSDSGESSSLHQNVC